MFLELDPRICTITPQRSIEWVSIQSLSVKICGFLKLVSCETMGIRRRALNYRRFLHSGVEIPDVEIVRDGARYHVPTKALLASTLMLAAFSLFSSVSSARVSLKSSGEGIEEGGVDSPPAEEVSESPIVNKRAQVPAWSSVQDVQDLNVER